MSTKEVYKSVSASHRLLGKQKRLFPCSRGSSQPLEIQFRVLRSRTRKRLERQEETDRVRQADRETEKRRKTDRAKEKDRE